MPEIAPKEKRAKSSLTAFQAFFGKPCCRQTKYNSTGPKTRSKCEGQANRRRSEEHTSELQSRQYLVCRLLLEKKKETDNALQFGGDKADGGDAGVSDVGG